MKRILVVLDQSQGRFPSVSWDALSMGQSLAEATGGSVAAAVLGSELRSAAASLQVKAVEEVLLVEDPGLSSYDPDFYCEALRQVISEERPDCVLFPHSYQGLDLCPRLSALLGVALLTDCVGFRRSGENVLFVRQMFRSKIQAEVRIESGFPWLVSVQAGACSGEAREGTSPVRSRAVNLGGISPRRKQLEVLAGTRGTVDLSKAERVVAVGRGIKSRDNLALAQELADVLGAEIGASRPVVDSEWLSRDRQIGSSGQTVSARLYLAFGISGAIQHVVGMKNSDCIVAVNSDPNAPIFGVADYGIVGDVAEVIPALTKRVRQEKED